MHTYLVGLNVIGYKTITLDEVNSIANSTIIIVTYNDESKVGDYYDKVKELLTSSNRVILITVGETCNVSESLISLMCSYRKYDIYNVMDKNIIDNEYIQTIIDRKPEYIEASTYLGGKYTGYSEINSILLGIESLVEQGDIEGLKDFIETHMNSIENLTTIIDSMKQSVEECNSTELVNEIKELTAQLTQYKNKVDTVEMNMSKLLEEKQSMQENLVKCKEQLKKEQLTVEELQTAQLNGGAGGPIIREYTEINTSLIKCKTQKVLYFKEVSKIPYINSMILALMARIKIKCKVKLLIYDNNSSIPMYSPLTAIDTKEYLSKRELYCGKKEVVLISEPNSIILTDILQYSNDPNTIVIIYDRMKKKENLVSGNNIYKFFVLNSNSEYNRVANSLNITDKSTVIAQSKIQGVNALDIPYIKDYANCTESGKSSKYFKAISTVANKPLIESILKQIRFDSIQESR